MEELYPSAESTIALLPVKYFDCSILTRKEMDLVSKETNLHLTFNLI
jgi:hypothetical protein